MKTFNLFITGLCLAATISCGQQVKTEETMETTSENKVIENIMARRSIRKYKDMPVEREVMTQILECGINAPNGQNKQSWEIRIVDKPETMEMIKDAMAAGNPEMDPEMVKGCFRGAPVMAFIARDLSYDFSAYDCGLLAENMMLSAWSLGVGSICLGSPIRFINGNESCAQVLELLDFSEGYELCLCVGFGYADETPDAKPRDFGKAKFID